MAGTPNTIQLTGGSEGCPVTLEAVAASAITPGDLIEFTTAGTVQAHSSADGISEKLVALENLPAGGTITDAYAASDTVRIGRFKPGSVVYMTLAASQVATLATPLVSNGAGKLKINAAAAASIVEGAVIGYPVEAVTTTGSTARIKVRIL